METGILAANHNCIVIYLEQKLFEKEATLDMMKRN